MICVFKDWIIFYLISSKEKLKFCIFEFVLMKECVLSLGFHALLVFSKLLSCNSAAFISSILTGEVQKPFILWTWNQRKILCFFMMSTVYEEFVVSFGIINGMRHLQGILIKKSFSLSFRKDTYPVSFKRHSFTIKKSKDCFTSVCWFIWWINPGNWMG